MSLLSAPRQVSRTFKNIGRIKQISSVFAKYGFQELMGTLGFSRFIPEKYRKSEAEIKFSAPERLRMAFEELGPSFIKLGQLLSSRSDLLPEEFVRELSKLQDQVSPLPFTVIKHSVERELNASLGELFSSFDETPLASASIGQVHAAVLNTGESVVVKVQRPGIDTLIKADVSVLTGLASALEKYFPETKVMAPQVFVEEFFQAMSLELDFNLEANNILKSRANLKDMPEVYLPEVHLQLCSHKVLVIERLSGVKLDDIAALSAGGFDRKSLAEITARAFLKTALEDGFFHGDLHIGNLFALPAEGAFANRVGMIDFGIMGYLTPRARESLLRIFVALSEEDFETLCLEFAELGASRGKTDFDSFQRSIHAAVAPYLGLPLSSLNVGKVLIDATSVAARHQIRIPREWMIIFKALYTLEGTCQKLDPNFNPMPLLESYVAPLLQPNYDWEKMSKGMLLGSRDVQQMVKVMPRQMHWFFKRLAANGYAIEIKNSDAELDRTQSEKNFRLLSTAIVFFSCLSVGAACFFVSLNIESMGFRILGLTLLGAAVYSFSKLLR
ncbi:MAG: ABC1 kinase family protein [Bdellovibrionota bacterium]